MIGSDFIALALEVRRGNLKLASVPEAERPAVRSALVRVSSAQMGRLASAREHKPARLHTR